MKGNNQYKDSRYTGLFFFHLVAVLIVLSAVTHDTPAAVTATATANNTIHTNTTTASVKKAHSLISSSGNGGAPTGVWIDGSEVVEEHVILLLHHSGESYVYIQVHSNESFTSLI